MCFVSARLQRWASAQGIPEGPTNTQGLEEIFTTGMKGLEDIVQA